MRFEWAIPHPHREWLTLAANLPSPYSITVLGNDDLEFVRANSGHTRQYPDDNTFGDVDYGPRLRVP